MRAGVAAGAVLTAVSLAGLPLAGCGGPGAPRPATRIESVRAAADVGTDGAVRVRLDVVADGEAPALALPTTVPGSDRPLQTDSIDADGVQFDVTDAAGRRWLVLHGPAGRQTYRISYRLLGATSATDGGDAADVPLVAGWSVPVPNIVATIDGAHPITAVECRTGPWDARDAQHLDGRCDHQQNSSAEQAEGSVNRLDADRSLVLTARYPAKTLRIAHPVEPPRGALDPATAAAAVGVVALGVSLGGAGAWALRRRHPSTRSARSGSVRADARSGSVRADARSGSVRADAGSGSVRADAGSGSVRADARSGG